MILEAALLISNRIAPGRKNGRIQALKPPPQTMAQSTTARATLFILRELVGEVLYFPVWWYTHGLALTGRTLIRQWFGLVNRLSIVILLRTMGKPMYGDYTRSGRAISFFFRIFILAARLIALGCWTVVELVALLAWVLGPIISAAMLIRQLVPLR